VLHRFGLSTLITKLLHGDEENNDIVIVRVEMILMDKSNIGEACELSCMYA